MGSQTISVIIPVYNQYSSLIKVIDGFSFQYPKTDFEIIIVDDGSTDQLERTNANSFDRTLNIVMIHKKNAGRAAARNEGVRYAQGDILIFCDADRVPDPNFVWEHISTHGIENRVTVGAPYEYFGKDDVWHRGQFDWNTINRLSRTPFYYRRMITIFSKDGSTNSELAYLSFLVGNASMKRTVFTSAGGFNEQFNEWGFEHFEFAYRLQKLGVLFTLNPSAKNYHIPHARPHGFYEKHINNSIQQIHSLHPEIDVNYLKRIFVERKPFV